MGGLLDLDGCSSRLCMAFVNVSAIDRIYIQHEFIVIFH
jgi:hypothetical protein